MMTMIMVIKFYHCIASLVVTILYFDNFKKYSFSDSPIGYSCTIFEVISLDRNFNLNWTGNWSVKSTNENNDKHLNIPPEYFQYLDINFDSF